jgi:16S rRNA (guanine966-N2)-methyltransferase
MTRAAAVDTGDSGLRDHAGTFDEMRVVAGSAGGRALRAPSGGRTRPTADRVREAIFSMLSSMDALEGATVLDLFTGSGALGIEAVSRGATSAILVDNDDRALEAVRDNLAVLGSDAGRVTVVRDDALRYLTRAPRIDLVLADPPYDFDAWARLLSLLEQRSGLLVAETATAWEPSDGWETVKQRKYGGTVVTIVQRCFAPAEGIQPEVSQEGES